MRRLVLFCLLAAACAHAPRSGDPQNWLELRSEHFVVRTDLAEEDARKAVTDMELARTALMGAGWHSNREPKVRTAVVLVASQLELQEFATKSLGGFATSDVFDEPFLAISAEDILAQGIFKHELTHIINEGFLVSKPRWVNEGIACYLETLEIKRGGNTATMGKPSLERLEYLRRKPVARWFTTIATGGDTLELTGEQGYAFETAAWALVHYFVDAKPEAFDAYLTGLAKGVDSGKAFSDAFPGLHEEELGAAMRSYLKTGRLRIDTLPVKPWNGAISVAQMAPAESFALRADLLRLSPGYASRPELVAAEVEKALAADPGNAYALMLKQGSDPAAATSAHPDDWRAWYLAALRNEKDRKLIDQAAKLAPDNPSVLSKLAYAELVAGAYDRGLSAAAHAVDLAPGRSEALDKLAQAYAANSRCDEAGVAEQRAIDSIPDASANGVPPALLKRQRDLRDHCGPARTQQIVQRVTAEVKLKSCKKPLPRVTQKLDLTINFTLAEDGSAKEVKVTGAASEAMRTAMRRYVESCSYEPVVVDGKPQAVQTTTRFRTGK